MYTSVSRFATDTLVIIVEVVLSPSHSILRRLGLLVLLCDQNNFRINKLYL